MKFISYSINGDHSFGVVDGDGIIDLGSRVSKRGGDGLLEVMRDMRLEEMKDLAAGLTADVDLADIQYERPVSYPDKIACIGVNYANRNEEYKDGSEPPKYPSLFMRTADSFTGHMQPMLRPPESDQLDYEGEIVVVIGKEGRRIKQEDAFDHIAGLTIMNEGSIRDWLRHAKFNVTQGKNFVHSGSIGPWMVSADEFSPEFLQDMWVRTWVNDEERQADTTASMMFPIAYQISYLSTFFNFKPGDMIATGTPNGAGARFDPPKWLVPGDTCRIAVDGVGELVNPIEDEQV